MFDNTMMCFKIDCILMYYVMLVYFCFVVTSCFENCKFSCFMWESNVIQIQNISQNIAKSIKSNTTFMSC